MEHVRWDRRPSLRHPVIVAAFEGWNDAGEAGTTAVRYLRDRWEAEPFAEVDPEKFFDFTDVRPKVELDDRVQRSITWPTTELAAATVEGPGIDVITLLGVEPQLQWKTFCAEITDLARQFDASMIITMGALLAEVPHSRPVSIIGSASSSRLSSSLPILPSCYEGPTGIIGVLHDAAMAAGFDAASLWAQVPTYVPAAPSPKAALALVEAVCSLLKAPTLTTDLEIMSASYERQISDLVAADEETAEYVARLEDHADHAIPDADDSSPGLVEELERYLRNHRPD